MADIEIPDYIVTNFEELRAERGCSWEQLAAENEFHDARIAAYFRSRSAEDGKADRANQAPEGRKRAPKSKA